MGKSLRLTVRPVIDSRARESACNHSIANDVHAHVVPLDHLLHQHGALAARESIKVPWPDLPRCCSNTADRLDDGARAGDEFAYALADQKLARPVAAWFSIDAQASHMAEIGVVAAQGAQHAYALKRLAADGVDDHGEDVLPDCVPVSRGRSSGRSTRLTKR